MSKQKEIVRRGYDKVSYAYRDEAACADEFTDYDAWIAELSALLPSNSAVLDLGCGCGLPVAERLAAQFAVTGVDLSPVQIERARRLVPQARFIRADMSEVEFPPASFAAIVSFYAVIHLPLAEQPALFRRMRGWLQTGGYFLGTVGSRAWTGTEENWLGVPDARMAWSHADAETYHAWLTASGFEIHRTEFIPEGDGGHTLILARARN
ncbi:MAG TPA: class I SAM-dependent methyltransferase [Pyrinomonadaceae bacterium]|nr:class I SAM-dependent methyltransferase [Pyrinomonadaceae bacterium]